MSKKQVDVSELQDELSEYKAIRDRLVAKNDELKRHVAALVKQLGEALQNKAMLEQQLRYRLAVPESNENAHD